MDFLYEVIRWGEGLMKGMATLSSWFTTPIDFGTEIFGVYVGFGKISPLFLLGIDGLIVYISLAVGKWLLA